MKIKVLIVTSLALFTLIGCKTIIDSTTGEKFKVLDPNSSAVVLGETIADVVVGVSPFLGSMGAAVGGVLIGILGAWRKVKPKLSEAQTKAEQYHAVAAATVTGIEAFKEAKPEQWEALGKLISEKAKEQGINPLLIKNIIRGLRGLPPKA